MSDSNETVGFVAPDPSDLNALFPGYEIEGLIATGGMGAVYCAIQKSLDRTVALKILPKEFSSDAAFCEGFEAEAKAMARLNHPNLIGVYDFGEVNGMLYIIMEYVAGKSIYHSAHGQAIAPAEVNRLVTGVCNGLAHAHENGIIHRDIKPSNILLDLSAQPKIGDFGLARPIERKIQEGEEIFGTPHYTAPEVVNTPHSVDFRADIFSVGVLLHELLTGKLPANDPRPPSAICHCDPRYDVIVRRATHSAPAGRYSSAAEMAKDLSLIVTSSASRVVRAPVAAAGRAGPRVAAPLRPQRKLKTKKSSNSGLFILIALILVLAAGAYLTFTNQETPPVVPDAPKPTAQAPVPPAPAATIPEEEAPISEHSSLPDANHGPNRLKPRPTPEEIAEADPQPEMNEPVIAPAVPKFGVDELFGRARKIMLERAKPFLTTRETNLKSNMSDFGRTLRRQARKLDEDRDEVEQTLEKRLLSWEQEGEFVPEELEESLSTIPEAEKTLTQYRENQETIDEALQHSLSSLSATYILGLEKQIERLKNEDDEPAIALIQAEIQRTKTDPAYFTGLMLGKVPEAQ